MAPSIDISDFRPDKGSQQIVLEDLCQEISNIKAQADANCTNNKLVISTTSLNEPSAASLSDKRASVDLRKESGKENSRRQKSIDTNHQGFLFTQNFNDGEFEVQHQGQG